MAAASPLFGKRVLVTRPAAAADDFAAQLRAAGAEPIVAPTIAIGPPDDPLPAYAVLDHLADYAWMVFTSRSGVEAFVATCIERERDARALGDVKIAAIGPRTAAALRARDIRVDFQPDVFVGEAVIAGMLERTAPGDRVLLFRAQEAREVIPQALAEHGRRVDDIAAYKTRFVEDPDLVEKTRRADVLTFTSASTVSGFVANVHDAAHAARGKIVACIGPITAATAREAGMRVDVIAEAFTAAGLVEALGSTAGRHA